MFHPLSLSRANCKLWSLPGLDSLRRCTGDPELVAWKYMDNQSGYGVGRWFSRAAGIVVEYTAVPYGVITRDTVRAIQWAKSPRRYLFLRGLRKSMVSKGLDKTRELQDKNDEELAWCEFLARNPRTKDHKSFVFS